MRPPANRAFVTAALAVLLGAWPLLAPAADKSTLEQQIEALQKANQALEARVRALEAYLTKTPPAQAAPPVAAAGNVVPAAAAPPATSVEPAGVGVARTPAAAAAADSVIALREAWRQVARDMPEARVVELLGKPSRELRINGKRVWYYVYAGFGPASVFLSREETVSSFQPPNLGFNW